MPSKRMLSSAVCVVVTCALVALAASTLRGGHARPGSPVLLPLSEVAGVMGNANQKCCADDAVPCYGGAMSSGNCTGQLPWNCTCWPGIPGISCWEVTTVKMSDVCIAGNPTDNCSTVAIAGCYFREPGVCDDDGGYWSWWGFCTTCGCLTVAGVGAWNATYDQCADGSSACTVPIEG